MIIRFLLELFLVSISTTTILPSSATDWIDIGSDMLYSLETIAADWHSALWSCRGTRGKLANIDSNSTLLGLRPYLQKEGGEFWIGVYRNMFGGYSSPYSERISFLNWAPDEVNFDGEDACVALVATKMEMKTDDCETDKKYICSIGKKEDFPTLPASVTTPTTSDTTNETTTTSNPPTPSGIVKEVLSTLPTLVITPTISATPTTVTTTSVQSAPSRIVKVLGSDWIDIGSDVLYSIEYEYATWNGALEKCRMKGINGRLASFDSGSYKSSLRQYIKSPKDKFWIGLRKDESGEFKRIGSAQSNYFDWAKGEPSTSKKGFENCVELDASSMQWNDLTCYFRRLYICASDKEDLSGLSNSVTKPANSATTVTTTLAPSRIVKVLGSDWIDFGSDVLYSVENTYASWYEAFGKCTMKGINGRLASFESGSYKSSLRQYIRSSRDKFWIGLHKDESGEFQRIGCAKSSYFDWAEGEPNNHNAGKEKCVELDASSMQWNDLPCDFNRLYICASDKAYSRSSESPAVALNISMTSEAESSLTLTDIAKECHSALIAVSFLIVFVFAVSLVALVTKLRTLPQKAFSFTPLW